MNEKYSPSQKPKSKGVLSEEEAHDKANMMRAVAGINTRDTSKVVKKEEHKSEQWKISEGYYDLMEWRKINTDVTKEDYEQALLKVEEIEKLANEETSEEEREFKLKKILQLSGHTVVTILLYMFGVADIKGMWKGLENLKNDRKELIDAKTILKKLIEKGDNWGKEEIDRNRKETI